MRGIYIEKSACVIEKERRRDRGRPSGRRRRRGTCC